MSTDSLDTIIREVRVRHPYPSVLEAIEEYYDVERNTMDYLKISAKIASVLMNEAANIPDEPKISTMDKIVVDASAISMKICNQYFKIPENNMFNQEYAPKEIDITIPQKDPLPMEKISKITNRVCAKLNKSHGLFWTVFLKEDCALARERCMSPFIGMNRSKLELERYSNIAGSLSEALRLVVDEISETGDARLIHLLDDAVNNSLECDLIQLQEYIENPLKSTPAS